MGGFGGYVQDTIPANYDGMIGRYDVWESYDGYNWTMLTVNGGFPARAWMGIAAFTHLEDPRLDGSPKTINQSPRIFMAGGGNMGYFSNSTSKILNMHGKTDCFWSRDGVKWTMVNYEEGGGTTGVIQYSSQEWAKTTINGNVVYIGKWGMVVLNFHRMSADSTVNVCTRLSCFFFLCVSLMGALCRI